MGVYLYDFEGNELGFTDKIISSYRDARWNDVGTFELHIEKEDALTKIITENDYLFLEDENNFQDIIIGYTYNDDFTIYCRSLSWLLSKSIIPPTSFSGTISDCVENLLSISKGCSINLGTLPEITDIYTVKTDEVTSFSDTLVQCLNTANLGHRVRFSHSDNQFYLDILMGNNLDFYISENDCTLSSLTLNKDILDLSNSVCFKKRMKYMGHWNPSTNTPALYDEDKDNYATYYRVSLSSGSYTRFDISFSDGNYLYCDSPSGKWKKGTAPPDDFYVYVPDSSVSDKYKWYNISHKENKDEALGELSDYSINKDFSAKAQNLVFLKDYHLGDFAKLQYTLNDKTVSVPCQFSSVTINRDNIDNTENPTLKEVK
ncbi:MAG: hypothetical protein E7415_05975 [Ruminococcaceae bacterium]|nr:hypothetical protein [Oscillospiraceae bacterium]